MRGGARPRVESQGVGVGGIETGDVPAFPAELELEEAPEAPAVAVDELPPDDPAPLICPVHAAAAIVVKKRTTLPTLRFEAIGLVVTTAHRKLFSSKAGHGAPPLGRKTSAIARSALPPRE